MEIVNEGSWNKERNILSITLENQIGPATIVRNDVEQSITAYIDSEGIDLSAVKIVSLVLSFNATSDVGVNGTLNFNNEEHRSSIKVIAESGDEMEWQVRILPYEWFFLGTWNIIEQRMYSNQEWGSNFNRNVLEECPGIGPEMDNTIEWKLDGFRNGKPYGTIMNNAGADGLYGTYNIGEVPLDNRLRHLLPTGESTWEMDLATNEITIMKGGTIARAIVTKEDFGVMLDYALPYKNPYQPDWSYGPWDNWMAWSYRFTVNLGEQ